MEDTLQSIFSYIKQRRLIDFSLYKQKTILRRLRGRLEKLGIDDYRDYLDYLKKNLSEVDELINVLTIKVSSFFRNPLVFEYLNSIVLPEIIERSRDGVIKVWSAGCAGGEEPYSVAILMRELMKDMPDLRVVIIATDINRYSIEDAKRAVYNHDSLDNVKKILLERYFIREGERFRLRDEIKEMVRFEYHDVTTCAAPKSGIFSGYDLILFRNVSIYFEREISERVMRFFSRIINPQGYLVIGEAEAITDDMREGFIEVSPMTKIFKKENSGKIIKG